MRLVGNEGAYCEDLGVSKAGAARMIRHVGNYGEIYERNVGEGSKLKIPRGLNSLWNNGGVPYAPPIRGENPSATNTTVVARLDRAIQYSRDVSEKTRSRSVLDHPPSRAMPW